MMRPAGFLFVIVALAWPPAFAVSPKWARPYLSAAVPEADFVDEEDEFVILYSDVEVSQVEGGGLTRVYRQVLTPTTEEAQPLVLGISYDDATQALSGPEVWVKGPFGGYRPISIDRLGTDIPDLSDGMIDSGRSLFLRTKPVEPADKVIVSWEVTDRGRFPAQDLIWPVHMYPVNEFHVRAQAPIEMVLADPVTQIVVPETDRAISFSALPAAWRTYSAEDPWRVTILDAIPAIFVAEQTQRAWNEVAADVAGLFATARTDDNSASVWRDKAAELSSGASTPAQRVGRLAAYVQSLAYRNIAWGKGAYVPDSPSEVLRSLSGDCKGKTLLLQTLLDEIGIESTPVLVQAGNNYAATPLVPTIFAFNHVVLAIDLEGSEQIGGALADGPGAGWVLFDPTDELHTLGTAPPAFEGRPALWVDDGGELFPIHTRRPGAREIVMDLSIELADTGDARFSLDVTGHSEAILAISGSGLAGAGSEQLRKRTQEVLGYSLPGVSVTRAEFRRAEPWANRHASLSVEGSVPRSVRSLGGNLYAFNSPMSLLDIFAGAYFDASAPQDDVPDAARGWSVRPCCQGISLEVEADLSIALPAGWRIEAAPEIQSISAPWMQASARRLDKWRLDVKVPRGRFAEDVQSERLADVRQIDELLKQPFLLATD